MEEDDIFDLEIVRITEEGKGTGFTGDGKLVLVDGCDEDDENITVKVIRVLERTIIAERIKSGATRIVEPKKDQKGTNPYPVDDEEYYDDEDDEE